MELLQKRSHLAHLGEEAVTELLQRVLDLGRGTFDRLLIFSSILVYRYDTSHFYIYDVTPSSLRKFVIQLLFRWGFVGSNSGFSNTEVVEGIWRQFQGFLCLEACVMQAYHG